MILSGRFQRFPNLLNEFLDDDNEIISASDESVVYSDGFILLNPFEPLFLTEDSSLTAMGYIESSAKLLASKLKPGDESLIDRIWGEALWIWENDLCHRFGEWETPDKPVTPQERYDRAATYALTNKNVTLPNVAEKFNVGYYKLVAELQSRFYLV